LDISSLLHDHVYTAIVLGGAVEGETVAVLAGYAAHQGYVTWWRIAALSALVHFCVDQTWFLLGRWRGERLLDRFAALRRGVDRITPRVHRHRRWLAFSLRFMYGLRTAGPIAMGLAKVPWLEFLVFNGLGAVTWAAAYCGLGFAFGRTIAVVIGEVAHYEAVIVGSILVAGLAVGSWHWLQRAK
jgi:membrane protein DedA with SNARE-associated domain